MEKILKIAKINLLALVGLPLLLMATACKLVSKALEKIGIIVGMLLLTGALSLFFSFLKNPKEGLQMILSILAFVIVLGLVVAIVYLILTYAAAIVVLIWTAIISFFETIYRTTYTWFLQIFASCEADYQFISLNGRKVANAFACIFFTILRGVNQAIITVISFALPAAYFISAAAVITALWSLNSRMQKVFGLNLLQYLGKLDLLSAISGVVMFIALLGIVVVFVMSLGIEWHEWAQELKMNSSELSNHIKDLLKNDYKFEKGTETDGDTGNAYMAILEEHMEHLNSLGDLVESVLSKKDNPLLRSAWGTYFRNLQDIVEECSKYRKGIPVDQFRKLIPQIQLLEKQRSEVKELADKLQKINDDPVSSSVFFSGCTTVEKLDKRYKALCKTYHPDAEGGDKETFQKMKDEYDEIRKHLES